MLSPWRESRRRRAGWLALILAVLLAHGLLGWRVLASVIGWNTGAQPRRIQIAFTRRLQPSTSPAAAAAVAPPPPEPRPARAVRAARASSAPAPASAPAQADAASSSSRRQLEDEALALADRLERARLAAEAASAASSAVSAAQATPAAASAALARNDAIAGPERKPLDWPPSTRLTYTLTGLVRGGNLYGNAVVEWRRDGTHYQVQSDVHVQNLFTDRHIFSDGEITPQGLSPHHFDELLEPPLMAPRRSQIEFTDSEVLMPDGRRMIKLPQTQDEASQFVQFVWLFTVHPELARPGTLVDFPLALTRSMRRWHYRVAATEPLEMPFGTLQAVHLVPVLTAPRRPNEYTFEFWMAPTLQYLPVKVVIEGDEHNLAELTLDALPLQAAPAADGAASQPMLR